jgi:hypothetical protein
MIENNFFTKFKNKYVVNYYYEIDINQITILIELHNKDIYKILCFEDSKTVNIRYDKYCNSFTRRQTNHHFKLEKTVRDLGIANLVKEVEDHFLIIDMLG